MFCWILAYLAKRSVSSSVARASSIAASRVVSWSHSFCCQVPVVLE